MNEFVAKCVDVPYSESLVHRNNFEGCVGLIKTKKHALRGEHCVPNNSSTLGFANKGLHVYLIDEIITTRLLIPSILANSCLLPFDVPNMFEGIVLIKKEPSFVCLERNDNMAQLAMEPLQEQSNNSLISKSKSRKVNLFLIVTNLAFILKTPCLGFDCARILIGQDENVFPPFVTIGSFYLFSFDPGGKVYIIFQIIDFLCVGYKA